ncbi:carbohydrate esterase family 4 protein [Marasmius fiardii PR-910]|nr:carbohydrate esterase family 4 protein [Marasmius fiardii PR-910]
MQLKAFVTLALSVASLTLAGPSVSTESKRDAVPLAAVYMSCGKPKTVAITFDDGPYIYNNDILKILKDNDAKATFFLNGNNWDCIYDLDQTVRNIHIDGHQIGSHTWSHPSLKTLPRQNISVQMDRVNEAVMKITGLKPAFMRPPYGDYNDMVREVAAERGQSLVIWDFDSGDSVGQSPEETIAAYDKLIKENQSTIIALNHETSNTTAHQVIANVLPKFKAHGYTFDTVAGCLGLEAYQGPPVPVKEKDDTWTCADPK